MTRTSAGMERLAAARPPHLDPSAQTDPAVRATELRSAFTQPLPQDRSYPGPWLTRRRALAGIIAGSAAAGVAVAAVASGHSSPASPPQPAVTSGAAYQVLLAAAQRARNIPVTGRYWHSLGDTRTLVFVNHDGNAYTLVATFPTGTWFPRGWCPCPGGGPSARYDFAPVQIRPLTAADATAYARDGSPGPDTMGSLEVPDPPQEPGLGGGNPIYEGNAASLPADPAKLGSAMLSWARSQGGSVSDPGVWLFREGAKLLSAGREPLSAQTRATIYRMLAGLPGIRDLGVVRDPAGRPATEVSLAVRTADYGTLDWQLFISQSTDLIMARQAVVIDPGTVNSAARRGAVQYSDIVKSAGWTSQSPPG